jgi:3-oxoacyl-[acyl-carrier protein] reductase
VNARLRPAFLLTQAVLPPMRRQSGGRLIYVGSDHALGPSGLPGMIANGTSAAALVAFVRYLADELGPDGITANVVSPGGIESPSTARVHMAMELPPNTRERMTAAVPLGRMATPDDVARMIAFYAGPDSAFVTGTTGHVNGGFGIARSAQSRLR